jgi:hypothetical protein
LPPACATRSTSIPSRPSSWRSSTRPWSRPGYRSGFEPRDQPGRVVRDTEAEPVGRGLTPCMPCSVAPCLESRSEARAQHNRPPEVTVTVRWIPLVTAAYGTSGTAGENDDVRTWRDGSQLAQTVGPSSVTTVSWARVRKGSRQPVGLGFGITWSRGRLAATGLAV